MEFEDMDDYEKEDADDLHILLDDDEVDDYFAPLTRVSSHRPLPEVPVPSRPLPPLPHRDKKPLKSILKTTKMPGPGVPKPGPAKLTARAGPAEWLEQAMQCKYLPEYVMKQLCEIVKEHLMEGR